VPDADPVNGPREALLRADNLVLNEESVPSLRLGSSKINASAFTDTDVASLYTFVIEGTKYRLAGCGSKVYLNGTEISPVTTFTGSGDIQFGSHMGHGLMARGATKKKHTGTALTNWGIEKPTEPGTVAALTAFTATLATCNQAESPAFSATVGSITGTFPSGQDGTANGAIEITPNASSGLFAIHKEFAADTDFSTISGYPEDPQDLFDAYVFIQRPDLVEHITFEVGCTNATDKFKDDVYVKTFDIASLNIQGPVVMDIETVESTIVERMAEGEGGDNGGHRQNEEVKERIEERRAQRREILRDRRGPATNPGWAHLTCDRGQFIRQGNTAGRGWATVTGLRISAKMAAGTTSTIRFDDITIIGAAKVLALTGDYKFRYCWVKDHGNGWIEKSPPSSESAKVSLLAQGAQLTVSAAARLARDQQADQIWIYAFGGFLDRYYRVMASGVEPRAPALTAMRIDEFAKGGGNGSNLETAAQRTRFSCVGFTIPVGISPSSAVTYDILANEVDALIENEKLDIVSVLPPDDIIDIEGPHYFRTFVLTKDKLYPSGRNDPGLYNPLHQIRVGDSTEVAYWVKKTTAGMYVGTSKDIYVIEGDCAENPDETINLSRRNLNVGDPPISNAVAAHGNNIIYLAADGWRMLVGEQTVAVPRNDVDTLYKGYTRHGVSAPNLIGGRFRAEINKDQLVIITPEGASTTSSSVLHRFDFLTQRWYRHTYTPAWRSIFREPDGTLLLGDTSGFVWQLDTGTQDDSNDIPVVLWTKVDDDGSPAHRKDAWDILTRLDAGPASGSNATIALHLDGSGSSSTSYTLSSNGMGLHKRALKTADDSGLAAFRQIQLRITGNYSAFKLYDFDIAYRLRPKTRMFLDTGYFLMGNYDQGTIREVRLMADTPNDLTVKVYMDDTLAATETVTASANVAKPYTVPLSRNIRGFQGRVTVETTNSASTNEVGFECYWIKPKVEFSGNVTEKPFLTIIPDEL
jgi:hypothetical protein